MEKVPGKEVIPVAIVEMTEMEISRISGNTATPTLL